MSFWKGIFGKRGEELGAPVSGEAIALSAVKDEVFSKGLLGHGVAIIPKDGRIVAPCAGMIDTVFETGHALTMRADGGAQVLIHVGIDTVKLGGRHFELRCAAGERIQKGQMLLEFDPEAIAREGYDPVVVMIVLDTNEGIETVTGRHVQAGEAVIRLMR